MYSDIISTITAQGKWDSSVKVSFHWDYWQYIFYVRNKPDRATMRPDYVSFCIDYGDKHMTYMEGQMDEQALGDHLIQDRISP